MLQDERYELDSRLPNAHRMEDAQREAGSSFEDSEPGDAMGGLALGREDAHSERLERNTLRKLDAILLPFLCVLFLLNSMDKSNIGNAESAGFTRDAGLSGQDLNISLAFFFAFFVALQPVGAGLGRKFGMARWVPACMSLWGLCTILHIWVSKRWQLILLRICIASLEAGFYPTTVSYLSLFYTRFEFATRLAMFYGQSAVAGALGGVLSWAVFSHFPSQPDGPQLPPGDAGVGARDTVGWKSWEVLFLIEGCMTIFIALVGFVWLPHSADTAWFLTAQERSWAEERMRLDRDAATHTSAQSRRASHARASSSASRPSFSSATDREEEPTEAHDHLLSTSTPIHRIPSVVSAHSVTADTGLTRTDITSALLNTKIWHLLICNILSAIPATAFGIFLPLVIKQLSPALSLSPAQSNLLSAPPFILGAIVLVVFTRWSDRTQTRLLPILYGLAILLVGLTLTILLPTHLYTLRYAALCVLLSGSFIASPLTVAWLANNTPEPGKRAILLGINGWGNLAGVFSALLFTPDDDRGDYGRGFAVTLVCVVAAFAGFVGFRVGLVRENRWRRRIVGGWSDAEKEREDLLGNVDATATSGGRPGMIMSVNGLLRRLGVDGIRRGDEKLTFQYGL